MNRKLVYVLSDHPSSCAVLVTALEAAGYEPVSFIDGNALLAEARRKCPACILLKILTPELDGLKVLDELKAAVNSLPAVIVISGDTRTDLAFQAGLMGATDFIAAPFAKHDLLERVRKAIEGQSRQREFVTGLNFFYGSKLLTKRQQQVLDEMLLGKSTKNIAFDLGLSPRTVEDHRALILDKAKVKSTAQLFAAICEAGRKSTMEMPPLPSTVDVDTGRANGLDETRQTEIDWKLANWRPGRPLRRSIPAVPTGREVIIPGGTGGGGTRDLISSKSMFPAG